MKSWRPTEQFYPSFPSPPRQALMTGGATFMPPSPGNYDMAAVAMGCFVSARRWVQLANPSSTKRALKFLSLNNRNNKVSTSKMDSSDSSLPDFTNSIWFWFCFPMEFLLRSIGQFFAQQQVLRSWLGGGGQACGHFVCLFVDYTLVENTARWRDSEMFLTSGEIKNSWQAFFSVRLQSALTKKKQPEQQSQNIHKGNKSSQPHNRSFNGTAKRGHSSRCATSMYNKGLCQKPAGQCTAASGTFLRNVCDQRPDPSILLIFCGQKHRRIDNH
jgi:hypothetical protein